MHGYGPADGTLVSLPSTAIAFFIVQKVLCVGNRVILHAILSSWPSEWLCCAVNQLLAQRSL